VVLASGCPYHDAGASAVQELGLALAAGAEYIRALIDRGLTIDQAAPRVAMQMSIGCHFFMEIAKLRASRLLWTTLIEAFGGSEESQKLKLFARTSAFTKAALDPWVNLLRNTTEAFAGAMGLVDGLFVTPFDDPVRPADDFSRRVSRNLQIILQEECHFTHPIDPAGGAWYVETLTDQVAREAWGVFQAVEKDGGLARALLAGKPQALLAQMAEKRRKNLAIRKDVMVGVNLYAHLGEKPLASPDADWEDLRSERIEAARAAGEKAGTARSSLESLAGQAAEGLMAATIQAAKAGARLEDLAKALGQGEPVEASALVIERASRPFEDLRANAQAILGKTGRRPIVFLATMGPASQHKPRADFSTGFFEVGGFEVVAGDGYPDVDAAAKAALASGARIVVLCSTDATYPDIVPAFCQAVKAVRPDLYVVLAGKPAAEFEAAYKEAGLDDFIFIQTNCLEKLSLFQKISQGGSAS
jgi:methylmalonyl-CoA mutase